MQTTHKAPTKIRRGRTQTLLACCCDAGQRFAPFLTAGRFGKRPALKHDC
jgi:hypothetical protein